MAGTEAPVEILVAVNLFHQTMPESIASSRHYSRPYHRHSCFAARLRPSVIDLHHARGLASGDAASVSLHTADAAGNEHSNMHRRYS